MPATATSHPLKKLKPGMGLYQVFHWPDKAPDKSKPWAVANLETGDVNGRWHATKEEALAQARALYARLGDKAKVHGEHNAYFSFADLVDVEDSGYVWLEALPARTFHTELYGEFPVTLEQLDNMVTNFHENVRRQDIAINYNHERDSAKGSKAAGWLRDVEVRDGSLYFAVDFTKTARQEIKDGEWRYFSAEWDDEWTRDDGTKFMDVIAGGGLTNRPIAKGMAPINLSELIDYEFADWPTAYKNRLPDSAFAYIEPGGHKDSEGKTVPRSKRHFPYKDMSGKIDLPHVRNMIAQAKKALVPDAVKARVQALGRRLLGAHSNAEILEIDTKYVDETKELEHSEPGTGSPPAPRTDGDGSDDDDRRGGWRIDTPPIAKPESKGGSALFELADKDAVDLLRLLDLPSESDGVAVVEAARIKMGELVEFQKHSKAGDQRKELADRYPELWEEHNALMLRDRTNSARQFSESVTPIRKGEGMALSSTRQSLSKHAQEKVAEAHIKFAEGNGTLEDFENAIKSITNGGIVQLGEIGTSKGEELPEVDTDSPTGLAAGRKLMADLVNKTMSENEGMDRRTAIGKVLSEHPDLADAYRATVAA